MEELEIKFDFEGEEVTLFITWYFDDEGRVIIYSCDNDYEFSASDIFNIRCEEVVESHFSHHPVVFL